MAHARGHGGCRRTHGPQAVLGSLGMNERRPEHAGDGVRLATFDEHRRLLFSIAYRMLGSIADTEDMLQEAFIRSLSESIPGDDHQPPLRQSSAIGARAARAVRGPVAAAGAPGHRPAERSVHRKLLERFVEARRKRQHGRAHQLAFRRRRASLRRWRQGDCRAESDPRCRQSCPRPHVGHEGSPQEPGCTHSGINGEPGAISYLDGRPHSALILDVDDGRVRMSPTQPRWRISSGRADSIGRSYAPRALTNSPGN